LRTLSRCTGQSDCCNLHIAVIKKRGWGGCRGWPRRCRRCRVVMDPRAFILYLIYIFQTPWTGAQRRHGLRHPSYQATPAWGSDGQADGREEVAGEIVIARGNPPDVLDPSDGVPVPVSWRSLTRSRSISRRPRAETRYFAPRFGLVTFSGRQRRSCQSSFT